MVWLISSPTLPFYWSQSIHSSSACCSDILDASSAIHQQPTTHAFIRSTILIWKMSACHIIPVNPSRYANVHVRPSVSYSGMSSDVPLKYITPPVYVYKTFHDNCSLFTPIRFEMMLREGKCAAFHPNPSSVCIVKRRSAIILEFAFL